MPRMRRWLKSDASRLGCALYPKVLNSTEDVHAKSMSTLEAHERLREARTGTEARLRSAPWFIEPPDPERKGYVGGVKAERVREHIVRNQ